MQQMQITGFRVLIRPDDIEKVSKGGILIAQNERQAQAAQTTGTILSIGPTAWMQFQVYDQEREKWVPGKPWAEVGDHVVYTRYGGRYIPDPEDESKSVIIINDEDVLAVLPKQEEG